MKSVLVDSNVLLDVATEDPRWSGWSSTALEAAGNRSSLVINPLIYAEVSIRFATIEELEWALPAVLFRREALPYEAGFLAGKVFLKYRRQGGSKPTPLPDFYIGAHAAVAGYQLLTRDASRYRTYFPRLELLAPGR
ncbi:MAG: type II toxin-antitoxin system VapC family toxin [Candidatus Wallbacteria bacterium]|nr:type II toxin-antitoxin system VapC family toxin [Candidatus Wallbacteria bacterium]